MTAASAVIAGTVLSRARAAKQPQHWQRCSPLDQRANPQLFGH